MGFVTRKTNLKRGDNKLLFARLTLSNATLGSFSKLGSVAQPETIKIITNVNTPKIRFFIIVLPYRHNHTIIKEAVVTGTDKLRQTMQSTLIKRKKQKETIELDNLSFAINFDDDDDDYSNYTAPRSIVNNNRITEEYKSSQSYNNVPGAININFE